MTEPIQPAITPEHAIHDPMWMAALASRDADLSPQERTRAQAALDSCAACTDLFADLVAVSTALPTAATPSRPRDFTLTPADAARLRPRGLRRWFAAIGSARDGVSFPLALGLTTMGIAGLLVATVPTLLSSGAATPMELSTVGAPVDPRVGAGGAAPGTSGAAAASAAPAQATDVYAATDVPEIAGEGAFTGDDGDASIERQDAKAAAEAAIRDDRTGMSALVVLAGTFLVMGLGLFMLRWSARRL